MPGLKPSQEFLSRFSLFAPTKVSTGRKFARNLLPFAHDDAESWAQFQFRMHQHSAGIFHAQNSNLHKFFFERRRENVLRLLKIRAQPSLCTNNSQVASRPQRKSFFHPSKLITIVSNGIGIQFLEENGNVKVHFLVFVISFHYHQNIFPPFIDISPLRPRSLTVTNKIEQKILSFE